jgi:hypothetical protein
VPLFAFTGHDGPRGRELRWTHRPAHLARWQPLDAAGRVLHGGPLLDDEGQPIGSLLIFEAPSLAEARAFAAGDPYVVEGIFERWEVRETRAVFPQPKA